MDTWYAKFKAIANYNDYGTEELKKIKRGIEKEYREFFYGEDWDKAVNYYQTFENEELKKISTKYIDAIEALEHNIFTREGVYDFYEIETGNLIYDVITSNIFSLKQYELPINVEIIVETPSKQYETDIEDVENIQQVFRVIESSLNNHRWKKRLKLCVKCHAMKDGSCYDGYYSIFQKKG